MSLVQHLKIAAWSGILLGLSLGHLDLLVRLSAQNIEWIEVHLSMLMPVLVFGVAFIVFSFFLFLLGKFLSRNSKERELSFGYRLFSISFIALCLLVLLANLAFYGDVLFWSPKRFEINVACFFLFIVFLILFLKRYKEKAYQCFLNFQESKLSRGLSHYIFFLTILLAYCFFYDLYNLHFLPEKLPTKASSTESPNVILISLDTLRSDHMSVYGYEKDTTPNLAAFAKDAVVFEAASSVSNWTLPAHASIFTGKYIFNHKAHETHQKLVNEELTLAEILGAKGYHTAGFIGGPYSKAKYGIGQGFGLFADRLDYFEYRHCYDVLSVRRVLDFFSRKLRRAIFQNDGERISTEINHDVFKWLAPKRQGPFFLFINYFDPHDPYDLGLSHRSRFALERQDDDVINEMVRSLYFSPEKRYLKNQVSESLKSYMQAMYDTEIYFLDQQLGVLFEQLKQQNLMENSIIILVGDHGEEFFEHGGVMHKQTLYEEMLYVPLLVYYPKAFKAKRVKDRVSVIDVFPTILELVNIEVPKDIDGLSLEPLLAGSGTLSREYVIAQRFAQKKHGESYLNAIIGQRWKYIEVEPELERMPRALFDLEQDPHEQHNLISTRSAKAAFLAEKMKKIIGSN